jgi:hypothetical protein
MQSWFSYIAAVLLFIIALPLWLAAWDNFDILFLADTNSLLPLTNRQILYVISGSELALSAFLLLVSHLNSRLLF